MATSTIGVALSRLTNKQLQKKGRKCKDYGIDIMFEDNDGYIEDIKRQSPLTRVIKVSSVINL